MADILKMYNNSTSKVVQSAKQIPTQAVHFFDRNEQVNKGGFELESANKPGQTNFTDDALNYFNTELNNLVVPQGFIGPLDRYNPNNPYDANGSPMDDSSDIKS
jgi:hypothetical protein